MYDVITEAASLEELKQAFEEINKKMEGLESREPEDENSSAYEAWEADCEALAVRSETIMTWIDRKMSAGL